MTRNPASLIKIEDIITAGWTDYELLDSGAYQKLERFGKRLIVRTEPAANWKPAFPAAEWVRADAEFSIGKSQSQGVWKKQDGLSPDWTIRYKEFQINLFITGSRHIGVFPEQHEHWDWIEQKVKKSENSLSVLNLFGYTGISTLAAASAGALVTHVDASKSSVDRAKKNLEASGLSDRPVRWIVDDAYKFVQREIRRGKRYDAIIMDPPSFGRGPKGEVWKFDKAISALLTSCLQILSDNPSFFIITAYNVNCQASDLGNWLGQIMAGFSGRTLCGNLIQKEKSAGRKIHQAIYSKWERRD
ncbi:MAG: class I SAM-dependent methyltransferase [Pelolinea sp.]|nr:class I SAM-dependent methyltransferase [Pelolinea sp.]